jgi:hypothetical protein
VIITDPEQRVDRAGGADPGDRQTGHVGELVREQPRHQLVVDLELTLVHDRHPYAPFVRPMSLRSIDRTRRERKAIK